LSTVKQCQRGRRSSPRGAAYRFKRQCERVGDVVFSIARVIEGEPPQSVTAAIEGWEQGKTFPPVGAK
jgi:hypothetical protein